MILAHLCFLTFPFTFPRSHFSDYWQPTWNCTSLEPCISALDFPLSLSAPVHELPKLFCQVYLPNSFRVKLPFHPFPKCLIISHLLPSSSVFPFSISYVTLLPSPGFFFSSENCRSHDITTLQIYFSVFSVYLSMLSLRFSLCLINFLQKKFEEIAMHCSVQLKVQICRSEMP